MKNSIENILVETNCFKIETHKTYTWASGIESPFYCDNRLLLSHPENWKEVINLLEKEIIDIEFDAIAAVATAGIAHGAALAQRLECPFLYVRSVSKKHGRQNQIEGMSNLTKPKSVVLIEDLFSTGNSSVIAAKALEESGIEVKKIFSIFSYQLRELTLNMGKFKYQSLTTLEKLLQNIDLSEEQKTIVQKFLKKYVL